MASTTSSATLACAPRPSTPPPRSFTTTPAPSAARSSAIARPMPRPAPVTTAPFPARRPAITAPPLEGPAEDAPSLLRLLRRGRVHEPLRDGGRHEPLELVEGPVARRLVEGVQRPGVGHQSHRAPGAEEYLPVHVAGVFGRQLGDHRGHVVGVELLDLCDPAVLALDALLLAQLAAATHLLVDGHARPGHRRDRVHRDAVFPEVARGHL